MGGEYGMAGNPHVENSLTPLIVPGSIWFYAPNKGAPIAWALFFSVSCAVHTWQCLSVHPLRCLLREKTYNSPSHYKSSKFTGLLPWAALVFTAGYIMRVIGAYHYGNLDVFISSICLVYAAP